MRHKTPEKIGVKFYFAIVPFLFIAGTFSNMMAPVGESIGFRIGFGSVINNAITIVVSICALFVLRAEANASSRHRVGYGILQASFLIALCGLLWYEFAKNSYNPYTIYIVFGTAMVSSILAIIGPMIMLYAATHKKAFLITTFPYVVVVLLAFMGINRYSTLDYFPSVVAPVRLISFNTDLIFFISHMIVGMLLAMILFDTLTFEKLKSIKQWTKHDINKVKKNALAMSLLITGVTATFSISFAISLPIFNIAMITENFFLVFMMIAISLMIGMMIKSIFNEEQFLKTFKKSPSKAIYMIYVTPVMISILMMIYAIFLGILSIVILGIYGYALFKANRMLEDYSKEALKGAIEEEERPVESKLVQITRAEVGMLVKRNLKYMVVIPPVVAMIFLPLWKLSPVLPMFQELIPEYTVWVDLVVIGISCLIFIEIWYAKQKVSKSDKIWELVGASSIGGGLVLIGLILFFYTVSGGNLYVLIILIAILQVHTGLYYLTVYPPLLERLNTEPQSFFMAPEEFVAYIKNLQKADKELYTIPKPDIKDEPAAKLAVGQEPGVERHEAPAPAQAPVPAGKEPEVPEGKGQLVSREPESALEYRRSDMRKKGLIGMAFGVVISVALPLILVFGQLDTACFVFIALSSGLGIILIIICIYVISQVKKLQPITVYENGIEAPELNVPITFYPFAGFLSCSTKKDRGREVLTLQGATSTYTFEIWPGLEPFATTIPEKVGIDPGKMPAGAGYRPDRLEKLHTLLIPIAVIGGLVMAVLMALIYSGSFDPVVIGVAGFPMFAMFLYTYLVYRQKSVGKKIQKPFIVNKKHTTAIFALCIIISVLSMVFFSQVNIMEPSVEFYKEDLQDIRGELVWDTDQYDRTIYFDNWLFIDGDITISNCTLTFNCTKIGEFGIIILKHSNVSISRSTLKAPSPGKGFKFEARGPITIEDSNIYNIFGDKAQENGQGGVELYADSGMINTTIQGSLTNGILIGDCDVLVRDCRILNTGDEGIEIINGKLTVENSELINCSWGIDLLSNAEATITNTNIIDCEHALTLAGNCEVEIRDSRISGSTSEAIRLYPGSELTTDNLELENNAQDYEQVLYYELTLCCLVVPLIITCVCYGVVRYLSKGQDDPKLEEEIVSQ